MSEEGWISVNDRLPTEQDGLVEKMYIGTDENGNPEFRRYVRVIAHFARTDIDVEEICETNVFIEPGRRPCKRITHWQPLPTFQGRRL